VRVQRLCQFVLTCTFFAVHWTVN